MGKTKPHGSSKKSKNSSAANKKPKMTAPQLLAQATALLQTSQADEALVAARRAYALLHPDPEHTAPTAAALPALTLLGEINVELGDIDTARDYFLVAAALDEDGAVVMLKQYRHPIGEHLWELPAGLRDAEGEPPPETARRELAEEVQLAAERWSLLASYFSSPGFCDSTPFRGRSG